MWLLCALTLLFGAIPHKIPVTEDFEKGSSMAALHHRPMVVVFTGSDWCVWSKKLLHDVLENPEFQKSVGNTFVFVKVDFPDANHQEAEMLQEHYELKEKFQVQEFPSVILLDSDGKEITRLGYMPTEPKKYGEYLLSIYQKYQELYREIQLSDLSKKNVRELEKLYSRSHELRSPHLVKRVLEAGLSREEGVFFPLEKYTELVQVGKVHSNEAKALRQQVAKRDPENREGALLRLALLDFQANVEEGVESPEKAVAPLQEFIHHFGDKEKETLAKLHLMISDYFHSHEVLAKGN